MCVCSSHRHRRRCHRHSSSEVLRRRCQIPESWSYWQWWATWYRCWEATQVLSESSKYFNYWAISPSTLPLYFSIHTNRSYTHFLDYLYFLFKNLVLCIIVMCMCNVCVGENRHSNTCEEVRGQVSGVSYNLRWWKAGPRIRSGGQAWTVMLSPAEQPPGLHTFALHYLSNPASSINCGDESRTSLCFLGASLRKIMWWWYHERRPRNERLNVHSFTYL